MPKDTKGKTIVSGQTVNISGKVINASDKAGANVLVETSTGFRCSVNASEVTVTADAPAAPVPSTPPAPDAPKAK